MIDINIIRDNPEVILSDYEKRKDKESIKLLTKIQKLDQEYRSERYNLQNLKSSKNKITKEISELKKQGKDIQQKLKELKDLPKKVEEKEKKVDELQQEIKEYLMNLPNITHESVPYGKDENDNVVVKTWGKKRQFNFELKSHVELAESLGVADFERAAKISGAGFAFISGKLALLHRALINFAIDSLVKKGYILTEVPQLMLRKSYEGVMDLEDFEESMYKIDGEELFLIGTSEHPLTAMFSGEVVDNSELPVKMLGYSTNYRKEIGAHGIDQKGLYRRHQFTKIEQYIICAPDKSWQYHEELLENIEEIYQKLELPYRVIILCTGDANVNSAKTYDLEVWMPRQDKYGELGSCTNCTSWQSRRSNIRFGKQGGEKDYAHTLNCTAMVTRCLVAILENYQNKDGSVSIPKVLQPYMDGITKINPRVFQ